MLKVMSFNIRIALADDGENNWEHRKQLVADRVRAFAPDLLGLQECHETAQAGFIRDAFPDYAFYGVPRGGDGGTALEMAPLLFKKSAFRELDRGVFWLSETPDTPGSKSWDSIFPRTVTWVKLLHLVDGKTVTFANTHFDYQPVAIDESAKVLREWTEQAQKDSPFLLTGDFNAGKTSNAYHTLTGHLRDAYRQVHPGEAEQTTFHNFGRNDDHAAIDWLLVSDHFRVTAASLDKFHAGSVYPSDHYPVHAEMEWTG